MEGWRDGGSGAERKGGRDGGMGDDKQTTRTHTHTQRLRTPRRVETRTSWCASACWCVLRPETTQINRALWVCLSQLSWQ
jgi:hypothetical protein